MQLPGGLLYDRFGPRVVITAATAICMLGALFFAEAHSFFLAAVGRFMMGVGGAVSFVGVLLVASRWFPAKYFALIAGIIQALACVAAIAGQVPLADLVAKFGWRSTIFGIFIIGLVLVILIPLIMRDYPDGKVPPPKKKIGHGEIENLRVVFRNNQTWVMALYTFLVWAPVTIFAALWGVDFLRESYDVSIQVSAEMVACLWIGIAVGSPLFGWWSEKIGLRVLPLFVSGLIGFLAAMVVIYVKMPIPVLLMVLFIFGLGASGQTLSFAVIRDNNPPGTVGTAMGFNNTACVAGGAICQPLVGYLIHLSWDGTMKAGIPYYSVVEFQKALVVIPICYLLCAFCARFMVKETYCKHEH
jgi:MFS family permease